MAWRVLLVPRCGQQVKQASTWLLDCVSAEDFTLKGRTTLTLTSLAPSPSQGQVRRTTLTLTSLAPSPSQGQVRGEGGTRA